MAQRIRQLRTREETLATVPGQAQAERLKRADAVGAPVKGKKFAQLSAQHKDALLQAMAIRLGLLDE